MSSARRWAPLAAFLVLAAGWVAGNEWATVLGLRRAAAADVVARAYLASHFPTRPLPSADPGWFVLTPARQVAAVWPGGLLIVGAALLAVALRRRLGIAFVPLACVALLTGTTHLVLDRYLLSGVAGTGVSTALYSFHGPFSDIVYTLPAYTVWLGVGLGLAATLLPALLLRHDRAARRSLPGLRDIRVAAALGVAAGAATKAVYATLLAGDMVGTKPLVVGVGVTLASLVIGSAVDRRTAAFVGLAYAALSVAVSNAQGTGELVRAALLGVGVAAIAALRTVPWAALRARLNARRALPAVGGRGSL